MILKIKTFIFSHKIIVGLALIIIVIGGYFLFRNKTSGETRYITEVVQKGNINSTVTGTGQIEASDTVNLNAKASGDITYVGVKVGQTVKRGTLVASIDSRDAKNSLESARISLAKLTASPDTLTLLQKQNAVLDSYSNGWNTVSTYVNDMNTMMSNLENIYGGNGFLGYKNAALSTNTGRTKISIGEKSYYDAKASVEKTTQLYKSLTRSSSQEEINNLINEAHNSSQIVSDAIKNTESAFNYVVTDLDLQNDSKAITTRSDITSWISTSNGYVNSLSSAQNSIKENTQSLKDTIVGTNELDIRSAQLAVQSKLDAYNNYFIYAPFDGVVATLTTQVGEPSGSSIGTLITNQKLATISLNEVDIAKIKLGQKATMMFDAIDGLSITGVVAEIDSIGTVSQGVVTYNVKISLDVNDDRVKPGMSVSATIITNTAQDVIVVPSNAVKSKGGVSYVEIFNAPLVDNSVSSSQGSLSVVPPIQTEVGIGLVGDTTTEITSGLKEGDILVTKTITTTIAVTKSTTPSILSAVGGRGVSGGPRN